MDYLGSQQLNTRRHTPAGYVIWFDGTLYRADSMIGTADFTDPADFGAVFNSAVSALPSNVLTSTFGVGSGALIHVRGNSNSYKYSTQPVIDRPLTVQGEGYLSTVLEPSANVHGLTVQPPSGGMEGVSVRNLGFSDSQGNGANKAYLLVDTTTKGGVLQQGDFDNLMFFGTLSGKSSGKCIQTLGNSFPNSTGHCNFSRIRTPNFNGTVGLPTMKSFFSDSIADIAFNWDCIFRDWNIYVNTYTGANPMFSMHPSGNPTGTYLNNLKMLVDTNAGVPAFSFDNAPETYMRDIFNENGSTVASQVGIYFNNRVDGIRVRKARMLRNDVGIKWDSACKTVDGPWFDMRLADIDIGLGNTSLQSITGDAATKVFENANLNNTTNLSPNPLTGAQFRLAKNVNYPTPAATTFTAGASPYTYTNSDGQPEIVSLATPNGISAISFRGVSGFPITANAFAFYLEPSDTMLITWATTAPVFNKFLK